MKNFWLTLSKPFSVLAPMEDVTDTAFRQIIISCGRPDVFFTEFVNVDGMYSIGSEVVRQRLKFNNIEKPIVAQIWGLNPENFYKAAKELKELGFDGIDLNFGCPVKDVVKKGACAALIENRILGKEILQATFEGSSGLPISVKTRIGLNKIITEDWIGFLLQFPFAAISVHGRTAKEMSGVPAHWHEIGKAVKLRDALKLKTLIVGNGDIASWEDALDKVKLFGVDGVMIGRGIFHNPWIFEKDNGMDSRLRGNDKGKGGNDTLTRLNLLLNHVRLFVSTWGETKNFSNLKKYFKIYIQGFSGASDLRVQLMQTKNLKEVEKIIKSFKLNQRRSS